MKFFKSLRYSLILLALLGVISVAVSCTVRVVDAAPQQSGLYPWDNRVCGSKIYVRASTSNGITLTWDKPIGRKWPFKHYTDTDLGILGSNAYKIYRNARLIGYTSSAYGMHRFHESDPPNGQAVYVVLSRNHKACSHAVRRRH